MIQVTEQDRIVRIHVPEPTPPGDPSLSFAWDLIDASTHLQERDELPFAVVISSEGADFCLQQPRQAAEIDGLAEAWSGATAAIARIEAPTVAAINGDAIGPAWELALACDLRVASDRARLGSPEVRWGRIPSAGATQRLPRLVGPGAALRLLLLGEVVDARAALELGLVHRVAPDGEFDRCLDELLADLRSAAPIALAYVKEAARRSIELPIEDGLRLEADLASLLQTTHDRAEGIGAFLARRRPRFEGR